eukprot:GSChrysophyteH1.ASY1.ANO1.1391.1 assembled CDS
MGISRDSRHKRRATGGHRNVHKKKRLYESGRPPAMTKIGTQRVHEVRTRGGNTKERALRLDHGNFSWGSEVATRKARIIDVVYNASNNELVRTKTLVKNAIVQIEAAPHRQWYESHYGVKLGQRKNKKAADEEEVNRSLDPALDDQFASGRLLACLSSRPGQSGRADGYILEGKELEFYQKMLKRKGK